MPNSDELESFDEIKYSSLRKTRQYMRQKISRFCNTVDNSFDTLCERKKSDLLVKLRALQTDINNLNNDIHAVSPDETDIDSIIDEEEAYNDRILHSLSVLSSNSETLNSFAANASSGSSNKVKLPVIALPEFSNGKGESLEKFLYSFESIISKQNLSFYEKFVYLKGQLRRAPRTLIESLDNCDQTYDKAKRLLTEAFASPLTQNTMPLNSLVV